MGTVIDKYMICTLEKGELDDNGEMVVPPQKPLLNGCQTELKLVGDDGVPVRTFLLFLGDSFKK